MVAPAELKFAVSFATDTGIVMVLGAYGKGVWAGTKNVHVPNSK